MSQTTVHQEATMNDPLYLLDNLYQERPARQEPVWQYYAGAAGVGVCFWLMVLLLPA